MPTLFEAVREILRPELVQSGTIRLEETDPGSKCKTITLHKHGQAFVLRPDRSAGGVCTRPGCGLTLTAPDRLFPLFRLDVSGLAAMCDYIVFCQEGSGDEARLFVLLCELKSGNIDGWRRQVDNGRLLADYILGMARLYGSVWRQTPILRRGLLFSTSYKVPMGSLRKERCAYTQRSGGSADLPIAHYACGAEYPLEHFCA